MSFLTHEYAVGKLLDDDRAASTVLGVTVSITVILASVVGTFVLDLGTDAQRAPPQASFQFDYAKNASGNDTLGVVHAGGGTMTSRSVNASVSNAIDGTAGTR